MSVTGVRQPRPAQVRPASAPVAGSGRPGVAVLIAVVLAYAAVWVLAEAGQPVGRFLGELSGAEAVLLFSCSLVLSTLLTPIERAFGGLDRVALWHRRAAVAGLGLLIPHVALVSSAPDRYATSLGHGLGDIALVGLLVLAVWALAPRLRAARWPGPIQRLARATYERWLTAHRLTGLFVIVAVLHGAIVDPVLHQSTLLLVLFLIVGAAGASAYLYRELPARHVIPIYDYAVDDVRRPNRNTLALTLTPVTKQLTFAPGQFVFLALGGPGAWQRHPFSVSSSPSDRHLELTIKASGDYTRDLYDQLRPGVPAKLAGPFGGFDYRQGGHDQIWIAGGIGVTPFLSWIRSIDGQFDRQVEFFYSVADADEAVDLGEIGDIAERHPGLRVHLIRTDADGKLTPDAVMHATSRLISPWVYMCGPPQMMHAFSAGFRKLGVPADRIRWEQFDAR
jgi:predicted ferric reductase